MNHSNEKPKIADVISIRPTIEPLPETERDYARRNQALSNQVVGILKTLFSELSDLRPQES